jgi:hypothetical protein
MEQQPIRGMVGICSEDGNDVLEASAESRARTVVGAGESALAGLGRAEREAITPSTFF